MDLGITGRTALVTGGDSGIGWNTARLLLDEGATVILSDMDEQSLAASAEKLEAPEGRLHTVTADLSTDEACQALGARVEEILDGGSLDILVHCAGVTGAQGLFHEIDDEGWVSTLTTDLLAPVRVTRAVLPALRRGGWGRAVFLASEDAVQPYDDEIPYCSAKAGVLAFAKGLSQTYAGEGLLVNCVSPAFIHTPMTDKMMERRSKMEDMSFDEAVETFLSDQRPHMELGRRGEPDEVANVIVFLCSEAASFVNGSNYRVDAGSVATI
ncbi:SDR family NAD(P)-dependent oxidoreductase [Nocardioides bruguierae]|uniref:SDR family oxidoreductase n=1 Tax=Nocardioides bruguierae TaxID=2945102 RepID=A0A9X2D554_9ACTN|nr:SDR family oxidoreductase [Nocardioides bruguierae]MCL8024845.1 SDR family oxidoreductase [Nocardioides bruguierae]MCM0619250.1 SDR family oxidoreductase [Nocardioides bruguierae]